MTQSLMEQEALAAPAVLAQQFALNQNVLTTLTEHLRQVKPTVAVTVARGSSDHAATFAKYLFEVEAGFITSSAAPSVYTLYQKKLPLKNCLVIGISQSGASPDIAEMLTTARQSGAITVAFVNETASPLAAAAEYVVPLAAGTEKAVAATKSYIATLGALIQFTALLTQNKKLLQTLAQLPDLLQQAAQADWSAAVDVYQRAHNTLVIGRGFSFPIAQEAALKLKETAKIHAEGFSGAELLHGPFALVEKNFPLLLFAQQDASFPSMLAIAERLQTLGAQVLFASAAPQTAGIHLPVPACPHPVCEPLLMIQAFYLMAVRLSIARGFNPDVSVNLTKVTKTW